MKVKVIPIVIGGFETAERVGNRRTNRDHPNDSIVEIGQNTEKSPGDLRRLTVTRSLTKDYQLSLT